MALTEKEKKEVEEIFNKRVTSMKAWAFEKIIYGVIGIVILALIIPFIQKMIEPILKQLFGG